ncbi:WhiB family transcriptional regulator [Streptomyces sp. NBC_00198]|uniref:WhiB family transcriptional regulator n=1 Tax=Streptomyces sp. NBC_00198 TaxID=2975677 RepID=UPI0022533BC2|nr:WhiB family transcriptional regulator [Streptomyces sp. NBC_00198]MCX5285976.1 WhiB family transcriptional regulator [Streptomyces sp. NBC_00198]MCX5286285.1 WhiB family transcriptional regulator [Streptomyces sp. NBC_00198]
MSIAELLDGIRPGPWTVKAACGSGSGPDVDDFHARAQAVQHAVSRFCFTYCSARTECLESAIQREALHGVQRHGIYGGLTATGRHDLAVRRRKAAREAEGAGSAS